MRYSKLGLRALGLAILGALSLTAFFAPSAQATSLPSLSTLGQYLINLELALLATFHGTQVGTGSLLVQGRNLTIDCGKGLFTGKIENHTTALVTVLFEECVAWNFALTTKLPCTVLTPGEPTGSAAAIALALPILHGGENFVLFEPDNQLNFAEVELHGATCPLPLVNPVKGSVVALVHEDTNDTVEPLLLFSPAIQLLSGDSLSFGGFAAYLDGDAKVKLTGEHEGDKLHIE